MKFEKGRALVIGLARYREVSGLPEAVEHDAQDVASLLASANYCGLPVENVQVLLNGDATLAAMRKALKDIADKAATDETVVIFFSGHGARLDNGSGQSSALVAFDTKMADLEGSTILEKEFSDALCSIRAGRLLVLIDACHAGGAGVLKSAQGNTLTFGYDEKSLQRLSEGRGRVIMASSRADETSLVVSGARNSVFTEGLLRALRGGARTNGDGLVRVFDVFSFAQKHVSDAFPGRQHPIFKASDLEDNFPIALELGGAKAVKPVTAPALDTWDEMLAIMSELYPSGPTDQDIWQRAGGDISRLRLGSTGRANWSAALRTLRLGGGGTDSRSLLMAALDDFPGRSDLRKLFHLQ
ncbi:MAG: caspase family protein [Agrobacterium cavarae]|uniref:caspase family protein n=1 Tax=Agrobacterium cavarae TaxID=2528239 RepID=UPI0031A31569